MHLMARFANKQTAIAANRNKRNYDSRVRKRYEIGSYVYRYIPSQRKYVNSWVGPCKVLEVPTEMHLKVQEAPDRKPVRIHVNHVKPYTSNRVPSRWVGFDTSVSDGGEINSEQRNPEVNREMGSSEADGRQESEPEQQLRRSTRVTRPTKTFDL